MEGVKSIEYIRKELIFVLSEGDKANGTTEVGAKKRWVGTGEGKLAKFVAVLSKYIQQIIPLTGSKLGF